MKKGLIIIPVFLLMFIAFGLPSAQAHVFFQCPCLDDPAATGVVKANGNIECSVGGQSVACKHLTGGDGFVTMADGRELFMFGFHDVTYLYPPNGAYPTKEEADVAVSFDGLLAAETSAPTINVQENQDFYLTLSVVPMVIRPDLFDPHSVHFHGFANATAIFDGEPMASIATNQGASFTYYYNLVGRPGTYMYHCHVEASEHMQMGMLGNLFVRAATANTAYNTGDTAFDVEYPIQVTSFDPVFHTASESIQPLPFANMVDTYPMLNGRGYPDTINPNNLPPPQAKLDGRAAVEAIRPTQSSQKVPSLITATAGQDILIRLSSLSTVDFYTVSAGGLPMQIIGKDAKIYKGQSNPVGTPLFQTVNSVNVGGGESYDLLINTAGVAPGTYFLYSTNLNELTNDKQDFGGMMTEIVISAP
jgi:FtsP/CotA-like multicopper oxidase with cupredoxin domain